MQAHTLKRNTELMTSQRVGRGGRRGKTSGRGTKGQNARAGHKKRPEMRDLIKKLPKLRGHGKNRSRTVRVDRVVYLPINISVLEAAFTAGDTVTPATLLKKGLIKTRSGFVPEVKILGAGKISKALSVSGVKASDGAKKAIVAAGGSLL